MQIKHGNASTDGSDNHGWFVGSFMPPEEIANSKEVEIKYSVEKAGSSRPEWTAKKNDTSVCILLSGHLDLEFRNQKITLSKQGDYVIWGKGVDYHWSAVKDTTCITVRWPSKT